MIALPSGRRASLGQRPSPDGSPLLHTPRVPSCSPHPGSTRRLQPLCSACCPVRVLTANLVGETPDLQARRSDKEDEPPFLPERSPSLPSLVHTVPVLDSRQIRGRAFEVRLFPAHLRREPVRPRPPTAAAGLYTGDQCARPPQLASPWAPRPPSLQKLLRCEPQRNLCGSDVAGSQNRGFRKTFKISTQFILFKLILKKNSSIHTSVSSRRQAHTNPWASLPGASSDPYGREQDSRGGRGAQPGADPVGDSGAEAADSSARHALISKHTWLPPQKWENISNAYLCGFHYIKSQLLPTGKHRF